MSLGRVEFHIAVKTSAKIAKSLLVLGLLAACTGTATVDQVGVGADGLELPSGPLASASGNHDVGAQADVPLPTPTPIPTRAPAAAPTPAPRVVPDGWEDHDLTSYSVAVPGTWLAISHVDEILEAMDTLFEQGLSYSRDQRADFHSTLFDNHALIAFSMSGDMITASRYFGSTIALTEHDRLVSTIEAETEAFADNVNLTSEARHFRGIPGVLIKGSYSLAADPTVFMYQFLTHHETHIYSVTVTLFSRDDPQLATELFRSLEID